MLLLLGNTALSIRDKILKLVEFKGEWLSKRSATSLTHFTSPTGDYNGTQYDKSVLEFAANDAIGVFPDYAVTKDFEITMVLNMPDHTSNQSLIPFGGATLGLLKKRSGLDNTIAINDGGSTPEIRLETAIPAGWKKLKWVYDYSTTIHRIYINDIEQSWNGNNDDFDLAGKTFQSFSSTTNDFAGQLAELKIEDADGVFFSYDGEGRLGSTVIDKSGNGRHMTTSVVTHTDVNEPLLKNYTNEEGYTLSDGSTYYLNNDGTGLIASGVIIPKLDSDITKCTAFLVGGSQADLQFVGKVRPDMKKEGSSCIQLDGSNGAGTLGTAVTLTGDFTASFYFNASVFPYFILGEDDNTSAFEVKSGGIPRIRIGSTNYDGSAVLLTDTEYKITFSRVGSNVLVYANDILLETISAATGDMTFDKIGNNAASLYSTGKIFGIEFGGKEYPISEVVGTTSYARNDRTKQIAWTGGATRGLQNSYHSSVNDGFTKGVNELAYSEDFTNAYWTKQNVTIVNQKLTENTSTSTQFRIRRNLSGIEVGETYTLTAKIKPSGRTWAVLNIGTTMGKIWFNLTGSGSLGVITSGVGAIQLNVDGSYTCSVTAVSDNAAPTIFIQNAPSNGSETYNGDGVSGIEVFELQYEKSSVATPYQKTESSPTAGAELPYKIGGVYSNPAILPNGYNGAITKGKMVAFREDLAAIVPFYNQSTFASNTINLATLPANTSDQLLLDTTDSKDRKNLIAGVPDFTGAGLALVEKYTNQ